MQYRFVVNFGILSMIFPNFVVYKGCWVLYEKYQKCFYLAFLIALYVLFYACFRFAAGVGLTVRGQLSAEGGPEERIVFTSQGSPGVQPNRTVRLVDGPTPHEGIVQVDVTGNSFHLYLVSHNCFLNTLAIYLQSYYSDSPRISN